MTIKLVTDDENAYFLFGYDYKNSKDLTANEDGSYTITWKGTIASGNNPFSVQVKTTSTDPIAIKLIISDITIEAVEA